MDTTTTLIIVAFAGLLHATFQLSISVLTLLSGHSLGKKTANNRLFSLTSSYVIGVALMTILLMTSIILLANNLFGPIVPIILWAIICGGTAGIGVTVGLFYYRRNAPGTSSWLPRPVASYLHERTKATKNGAEAFGLGLMTALGELLFTIAPIIISALLIAELSPYWQLLAIALYASISLLPLVIFWMLIGGGHKISELQKWREKNKWFMQFASGAGLIILGVFLFINIVLPPVISSYVILGPST